MNESEKIARAKAFKQLDKVIVKNIKNAMSDELIEWAREVHGRLAQIARACGVSHRQVRAWSSHECGIAPRHHQKIFELTGISPVRK